MMISSRELSGNALIISGAQLVDAEMLMGFETTDAAICFCETKKEMV
jgi:hypothetical protein